MQLANHVMTVLQPQTASNLQTLDFGATPSFLAFRYASFAKLLSLPWMQLRKQAGRHNSQENNKQDSVIFPHGLML